MKWRRKFLTLCSEITSDWPYKNGFISTVNESESLGITNYEELILKIFGHHWNIYFCSYFKHPCLSAFLCFFEKLHWLEL
jgi:hypothetical protein